MITIASILLTVGAGLNYINLLDFHHILIGSFVFLFILFFYTKSIRTFLINIILVIIFILGFFYFEINQKIIPKDFYKQNTFIAKIISVDRKIEGSNLVILDTKYKYKIRVHTNRQDLLSGEILNITGDILKPEDFLTDSGRFFPYQKYLLSKDIVAVMYYPDIYILEKNRNTISKIADKTRFYLAEKISNTIEYPYDGIVSGMILGYRGDISEYVEEIFTKTGTIHVLVLSGYNIMLLAGFCLFLFSRLNFFLRTLITISSIIFLVLISGSGIASIRAGIMGILAFSAKFLLVKYDASRALLISFLILFFWSPISIFVDPGLHLSFLATFCMINVTPKFEKYFSFIPEIKILNLKEAIVVSIIIFFYMLPYMIFMSGSIQTSAIISNILMSLSIPIIMVISIAILIFYPIDFFSKILGILLSNFLGFIFELLELLSHMPTHKTPTISGWGITIFYICLNLSLFRKEIKEIIMQIQNDLRQHPN